jgi:hypothetical protein
MSAHWMNDFSQKPIQAGLAYDVEVETWYVQLFVS